jgi:hypothetical protein
MKTIFLWVTLMLISSLTASAQVYTHYSESKDALKSFPALKQVEAEKIALKKMPQVDVNKLLEEDRELEGLDIPFRFGNGFDVDYTLEDGTWSEEGKTRIWSMKFSSPGAYSLNFIFSELSLASGTELYVFNPDGSMVYGPVTAEQNISEGTFLTDLVMGDEVVIQLIEPGISEEKSNLKISGVVHAYKNMFPFENSIGLRAATLTCHNDVACFPAWELESNAVALVLLPSGTSFCSGSLLNNTAANYKPYFLSAFHCIDSSPDGVLSAGERTASENWAFRFNYKRTTCNGSTTASYVTYNQAYFRAAYVNSDFALMELKNQVTHANVIYLGWDRNATAPTTGTNIHHPGGDVMKISFDNNPLVSYNNTRSWIGTTVVSPANTHWIAFLDNGTAEGGSSGSVLLNTDKRVVGQLHGGFNVCPPAEKYYGRFDVSWTGNGTNDTRLSNWLDPIGSAAMTTNALFRISGQEMIPCTGTATFSLPPNVTVTPATWSVSSNLQIVSGQGSNSITVQANTGTNQDRMASVSVGGATKSVTVGPPFLTSIEGPSETTVGTVTYFYAYPSFSSTYGSYDWVMINTPSASITHQYSNVVGITFTEPGSYPVYCRAVSPCTNPQSFTTYRFVNVVNRPYYSSGNYTVSTGVSRQVNVSLVNQGTETVAKGMIPYTLVRLITGTVVAKGQLPASGGTLDFNAQSAGFYVLRIDTGSGTPETFKIILK